MDTGFKPVKHQRLLTQHLQGVAEGDIQNLMVFMPPGSAKSTYTSVLFPPYFMGRNPHSASLGISNTSELAERFSRRARNLVATPNYRKVFGIGVAQDSQAAGSWENSVGGEFFASGVGGAIAGRRTDLGLIDDPLKSREEADNERLKSKQFDWYVNDFLPRLKPQARQIIIQTRWAEDDLSGLILAREASKWTVLSLPMEAKPHDPLGRAVGERLWPEWFTDDMVNTAKLDVRSWNALYQQDPVPDDGIYFQKTDFGEYQRLPGIMHTYGASDYATTDGGGDYTEHGVIGIDYNGDWHLLDWWRGQKSSNVWIESQCDMILTHKPLVWFGEGGPIAKAIQPFLKRRMEERHAYCRLEWLPSIADKPTRARSFQGVCAMGKVFFPIKSAWKADLMGQLMKFPAGKYDDGVDVLSLLGRGLELVKAPDAPSDLPLHTQRVPREQGWMA